jgi:hypothetical protein
MLENGLKQDLEIISRSLNQESSGISMFPSEKKIQIALILQAMFPRLKLRS